MDSKSSDSGERVAYHHRHKETHCTNCGKALDAATNAQPGETDAPSPGAITICINCHHIMIYDDNLMLRNPTNDELTEIAGHPDIIRAMRILAQYKKEQKK